MKPKIRNKPREIALFLVPPLLLFGGYLKMRSQKVADIAEKRAVRNSSFPGSYGAGYNSSAVFALAFSPDGQRLATGDLKGTFKWWDTRTGAFRKKLDISAAKREWAKSLWKPKGWTLYDFKPTMAFSPNGRIFAVNMKRSLLLFDGQTGQLKRVLTGPQEQLKDLAFTPDSQFVACGTSPSLAYGKNVPTNGAVCLWNTRTGEMVAKLLSKPGVPYVQSLDISADGRWLVALCGERTVAPPGGRQVGKTWMVIGGINYVTQLWDLRTHRLQWEKYPTGGNTGGWGWNEVRFSPDSHSIAVGGQVPTLYETKTGNTIHTLQTIGNLNVSNLAFTDGGKSLLGSSPMRPICLWNISDGEPIIPDLKNPKSFGPVVSTFALSRDQSRVAYTTYNYPANVEMWDVSQMKGSFTGDFDPLAQPKRLWKLDPINNSPAF